MCRRGSRRSKRRTRKAIIEATQRLLASDTTPSIADIAAEADVSRRTVYMYFPTLEHLLIDATAGALAGTDVEDALARSRSDDARERVDLLVRTCLSLSDKTLPLGRRLIRLTIESPSPHSRETPKRGYRRAEWIASAIEPLRAHLSKEQRERLVAGLMVVAGWEAMVVLRDTCGLRGAAEARVMRWAARALVDSILAKRK